MVSVSANVIVEFRCAMKEILTTELAEFGALLRKDLRDDAENPLRLVRRSKTPHPRPASPPSPNREQNSHEWMTRHMRKFQDVDLGLGLQLEALPRRPQSAPRKMRGCAKLVIDARRSGTCHSIGRIEAAEDDTFDDSAEVSPSPDEKVSLQTWATHSSSHTEVVADVQQDEVAVQREVVKVRDVFDASTTSGFSPHSSIDTSRGAYRGWLLRCRRSLRTPAFELSMCFLVILNAGLIGWQTDCLVVQRFTDTPLGFRVMETLFCVVFTVEVCVKLVADCHDFFCNKAMRNWNIFDLVVVAMQIFEEFVKLADYSLAGLPLNLSFVRALRILRLIRVARALRVVRFIGELRTLISSMMNSMKFLAWTLLLLLFVIYIVGIFFTQVVHDHFVNNGGTFDGVLEVYFGSLSRTMLSLFQCITSGLDWDIVAQPLWDEMSPVHAVLFSLYIAFAVLALLNVITGVFVESALLHAKADKDQFILNNVRELFRDMGDGNLHDAEMTWDAFNSKLCRPEMKTYFEAIDLDPSEARGLFRLLDLDGSGTVNAEEFLNGCLRLRGPAKALDLSLIMLEMCRMQRQLQDILCLQGGGEPSIDQLAGGDSMDSINSGTQVMSVDQPGPRTLLHRDGSSQALPGSVVGMLDFTTSQRNFSKDRVSVDYTHLSRAESKEKPSMGMISRSTSKEKPCNRFFTSRSTSRGGHPGTPHTTTSSRDH